MKLQEYEDRLQELRNKWKVADKVGRRVLENQAKFIKKSIELYKNADSLYKYALDLFT